MFPLGFDLKIDAILYLVDNLLSCVHVLFVPILLYVCTLPYSFTGNSGPHRIVDKVFSNTRYFVIKSNNYENVQIAKDRVSTN